MLEQALGGIIEGVTSERVWEATRGNVLFARELTADLLEAGQLRQIHGVWRWSGGVGSAPRLQEAIVGRLDGLPEPGLRFFEFLSIGKPLAVNTAERVAAGEVLIDLERRGLIVVQGQDPPSIRFSHPLFGEVLRAEMPALLQRRINQQLAQILRTETERTPAISSSWQFSGSVPDKGPMQRFSPRRLRWPTACRTTVWPKSSHLTHSSSAEHSRPNSNLDGRSCSSIASRRRPIS